MAIDTSEYPNKVKANLWANKTYTTFFYNFMQDSKRYRGLIDLSDRSAWGKRDRVAYAEAELSKIKIDRKAGVLQDIRLDDWVEKVYDRMEDTKWAKTLKSHYKRYVSQDIGKKTVQELLQNDIKETIKNQRDAGISPRTIKQTIEVLRPVFAEAIANRMILTSPMDGVKVKLPKTKKIVTNATEELVEIYEAISKEFEDEPFYRSLYLFAVHGRRKGEILKLKWKNIDFEHSYYIIEDTKNSETQKLYLPCDIKELLLQFKMDTEYVYTSRATGTRLIDIRKTTSRISKRLGRNFTLHYLRNVIVSAMADHGVAATHMSGALGHKSATTIDRYLTLNYLRGSQLASNVIGEVTKKKKAD
ncbi:MAG TPA: hypothetical protein CFH81_00285 [Sulfurovum sp. UBA12169]|nr:MAG TPA: hypothetical protein CFH81_00285 [Sulfurovum sp. UBA12169]